MFMVFSFFVLLRDYQNVSLGVFDKCFLVLFHTPLFMFVRPLALLIFNNFTCFICFVINRPFTSHLDRRSKMDMKGREEVPEVRSNAWSAFERRGGRTQS
jgi:hypothetical protein